MQRLPVITSYAPIDIHGVRVLSALIEIGFEEDFRESIQIFKTFTIH